MTMEDAFRDVLERTGNRIEAIRVVREKYGLSLDQAKEIMLRAEGIASSLDEHQAALAPDLEQALDGLERDMCAKATKGGTT